MIACLAAEALLFLSEQLGWCAFNHVKGYTVLAAAAVLCFAAETTTADSARPRDFRVT